MRKCKRKDCHRKARRGWTHCDRHFTAGDSTKNERRKRERR